MLLETLPRFLSLTEDQIELLLVYLKGELDPDIIHLRKEIINQVYGFED